MKISLNVFSKVSKSAIIYHKYEIQVFELNSLCEFILWYRLKVYVFRFPGYYEEKEEKPGTQ